MLRSIVLFLATLECATAGSLSRPLRLRGGEDDLILGKLQKQGIGVLSKEEIVQKLNAVPTFCIMQPDGSVISLPDAVGGERDECCTWFMDAAEARSTLRKVIAANPDLSGLHLACHGLGDFVRLCDGWPRNANAVAASGAAPQRKLQGSREVVSAVGPQLITALRGQGLDPGAWQLAVFIAEELSQSTPEGEQTLLPVFLSPNDVRAAFNKNGLQEKALERVNVLELRQLLRSMLEPTPDAVNPWRAVQFVASREAIALAQDIAANAK